MKNNTKPQFDTAEHLINDPTKIVFAGAIKALPLPVYCELFMETEVAVKKRLTRGIWKHGVHAMIPKGAKRLWVNLEAVSQWALSANTDLKE